jgi:hypothetical protein
MMDAAEGILEQLLIEMKGIRADFQRFEVRLASLEQDRIRAQKVQDRVFGGVFAVVSVLLLGLVGGFSNYLNLMNRVERIEVYGSPKVRELEARVQRIEARR